MAEVTQKTAVGVVRVTASIVIPEMAENEVIDFRRKVKEILTHYAKSDFDLRMTELRPLPGR